MGEKMPSYTLYAFITLKNLYLPRKYHVNICRKLPSHVFHPTHDSDSVFFINLPLAKYRFFVTLFYDNTATFFFYFISVSLSQHSANSTSLFQQNALGKGVTMIHSNINIDSHESPLCMGESASLALSFQWPAPRWGVGE